MRYADPEFSYARSWIPACAGMTGVLGVLLLPIPAAAFDCAKAGTAVEKAICQDPAAKRLDDELGTAYGQLRGTLAEPEQKMLAMSQKRWIARREFCSRCAFSRSCSRSSCSRTCWRWANSKPKPNSSRAKLATAASADRSGFRRIQRVTRPHAERGRARVGRLSRKHFRSACSSTAVG